MIIGYDTLEMQKVLQTYQKKMDKIFIIRATNNDFDRILQLRLKKTLPTDVESNTAQPVPCPKIKCNKKTPR